MNMRPLVSRVMVEHHHPLDYLYGLIVNKQEELSLDLTHQPMMNKDRDNTREHDTHTSPE